MIQQLLENIQEVIMELFVTEDDKDILPHLIGSHTIHFNPAKVNN